MTMKLIALEIPDDPSAQAGWLERHLVGLDLASLVAELEVVHGPVSDPEPGTRAASETLDRLLGEHRGAVLERGLSALPRESLRRLLRRPRLLLELQALVLFSGGAHWRQLAEASDPLRIPVERGRRRLAEINTPIPVPLPSRRPVAWLRRPWVVSLATAAAVLAIVAVYDRSRLRPPGPVEVAPPATTSWGWSRPGALPRDLAPAAYFDHLATVALEWFKQRPDDPIMLARRIAEFRLGCSALILSDHPSLSPEDRAWLVEKCRGWAAKLDDHLAAVEAGDDPVEVRDAADDTVNRLINALRERARGQPRALRGRSTDSLRAGIIPASLSTRAAHSA